jgi:hypothetical protein
MGVGKRLVALRAALWLSGLALALISVPVTAHARVEIPAKAVWAWSFMNTTDWCEGCPDPAVGRPAPTDDLLFQNYLEQIADGVAAGVSVFLLDTFADAPTAVDKPRLRRVQLFADAARTYNNRPETTKPVCVAVLFDNQGFTPAQQQEFFAVADGPDASTSAYCTLGGAPIVASYATTSCAAGGLAWYQGLFATLRAVRSDEAFQWFHHQQQTLDSGFDEWFANCAPAIPSSGVTPNFIEFFSGDPLRLDRAIRLKTAMQQIGGQFVPGIPSARASHCTGEGMVCQGAAAKATAPAITGMSGWKRMLDAWFAYRPEGEIERAGMPGLNHVMYTLGFAGDLGEDASHSSSLYCDPLGRDLYLRQMGACMEPLPYPHRHAWHATTFFRTGYRVSHWTHRGFHRIDQEFAKWFLNRVRPGVEQEFVAWQHRQHPIDLDKGTLPADWCPAADVVKYGDEVKDLIYVTSFLREPARLHVTFGGTTTVIDLPAEQIFAATSDERQAAVVPYGPDRLGTPAFVLERNGVAIAAWTGRLEITDQPVQYDGTVSRNYQTYADFYELPASTEAGPASIQGKRGRSRGVRSAR